MQPFNILAGGLVAVAGAALALRARASLAVYEQARAWETVPGVVVVSTLREHTDGDGTSYRADIACSYCVGGSNCTTSRHTEGMTFARPEQSARALVAAYPVGRPVELRLDPANPRSAVLITGRPQHMVVILRIGCAAILAGIGLVLLGAWP